MAPLGFRPRSRRFPLLLAGSLVIALTGSALAGPAPRFLWSQRSVSRSLSPGQHVSIQLTLGATTPVENIRLGVVPALKNLVSMEPSEIPSMAAGESREVTLNITVPQDAGAGVIEGTIHVISRKRTVPDTLKVSLAILDDGPPGTDEDELPSQGVVTPVGTSATSFNPVSSSVRFGITGTSFGDTIAVFHNGAPVQGESLTIGPDAVITPPLLAEGRNHLMIIGQDSEGRTIDEEVTLWAGGYTLHGTLLDENGAPASGVVVVARLGDDQTVTQMTTSTSGSFVLQHMPGRTVLIEATASGNRFVSTAANGFDGSVLLKLRAFSPASDVMNNDFSLGTQGWEIGTTPVSVVPHLENLTDGSLTQSSLVSDSETLVDMDLVLNTSGEGPQSISRTFTTAATTQVVKVRYRFITSEIPGGYFGTEFNDGFSVAIRSLGGGGNVSESASMNGLGLGAFDASGATAWRELSLPLSAIGDTVQVDLTVANVADGLFDSQLVVDFVAENTLRITTLQLYDIDGTALEYLSADVHPYFGGSTRIHGTVTVEGAEDDGLASLVLEVIEGGGVIATAQLAPGTQTALLKAFGTAKKVQITSQQWLFDLHPGAAGGGTDRSLSLRARAKSTKNEETTFDAGAVQLLIKYDGTSRYGQRDEGVGGDDWARPSLVDLVDSYGGLTWGDFSNMNGGPFAPHASHRDGLDVDGWFSGYNARDAATAQTIIGHLNAPAGSQIAFVFVTYSKVDTDTFWTAIRDVELDDGRRARDVIVPVGGHGGHFHWRKQ